MPCNTAGCSNKGVLVWSFNRLSVRAQLMLLVVAVSVPMLGLLAYHLEKGRQTARQVALERVRVLARGTAGGLETLLRDHAAVLERIALRPQVRALDASACDPIITEFVRLYRSSPTWWCRIWRVKSIVRFWRRKLPVRSCRRCPGIRKRWAAMA
jgi:hypothetical protein